MISERFISLYAGTNAISFTLQGAGSPDLLSSDVLASGDVKISKDGGAFSNVSTLPVWEGNGIYSWTPVTAEKQAARVDIAIVDQTDPKAFYDTILHIETYGNASAQHGLALEATAQSILADTGTDGVVVNTFTTAGKAEVQQEATDALNAYDPPTNAEMEARTLVAASYATAANQLTQQNVTDALKLAPTAGDPAAGSVNADLDTLLTRTANGVEVTSTTTQNGVIIKHFKIYQGDDHTNALGNALDWETTDADTWPDLDGSGVVITTSFDVVSDNVVTTGDAEMEVTGSIVTATGATKKVRAEPLSAKTSTLATGEHVYTYQTRAVMSDATKRTLAIGTITVIKSRVDS